MQLSELAAEDYVVLTTFRRSGEPVATPVWVVADPKGDGVVVMTIADSGKVKRIRNDPRVTLQACGRFGLVEENSPVLSGQARVGEFDDPIRNAFKAVYGNEFRLAMAAGKLRQRERVALHIS